MAVALSEVALDRLGSVKRLVEKIASNDLFDVVVRDGPDYRLADGVINIIISASVLTETVTAVSFRYPADWWEALKERWLPEWGQTRWPVKYYCHKVDIVALYPNYRPPVDTGQIVSSKIVEACLVEDAATPVSSAPVSRVVLNKERFSSVGRVSVSVLDTFAISVEAIARRVYDDFQDSLLSRIEDRKAVEVRYPADWWEALKERWLPEWGQTRWPGQVRSPSG